ncbi:hypothetical protein [Bradyrhizobium ontarionense]|uniref:hypothetical protein n=1 Tax=Bradyrhizobium ontarionense TaxID=2898149 RepID=UPI0031F30D18
MDFWYAAGGKAAPLIVFVHGGGRTRGHKRNAIGVAKVDHLIGEGYAFASINYAWSRQRPWSSRRRMSRRRSHGCSQAAGARPSVFPRTRLQATDHRRLRPRRGAKRGGSRFTETLRVATEELASPH